MKRMKKILAMLLAVVMVMGLSVTVFAEEATPGKITVSNVPKDATVSWTHIVEKDRESTDGWKAVADKGLTDTEAAALIANHAGNDKAAAGEIDASIEKLIESVNQKDRTENITEGKVADGVKGFAYTSVADAATGTATIDVTEAGLYVIEVTAEGWTFSRMLAYVDYDYEDGAASVGGANVNAKGETNEVTKEVTGSTNGEAPTEYQSVAKGDKVPFTVTLKYPFLRGTTENGVTTYPTFSISDTVTGGTVVKDASKIPATPAPSKAISVMVNNEELMDNSAVLDSTVTADNSFKVDFTYDPSLARKDITITYWVEVGEGAELSNSVKSNIGDVETSADVVIKKTSVDVVKYDQGKANTLAGAKFKLYVVVTGNDITDENVDAFLGAGNVVTERDKNNTLTDAEKGNTCLKLVEESAATEAEGKVVFNQLDATAKDYYVVESQAPTGYSLNTTAVKLIGSTVTKSDASVNGKKTTTYTATPFTQVDIEDTKLASLPSTGGIGTTIFTIGGCAIMIIAAGLFFVSRRKASK